MCSESSIFYFGTFSALSAVCGVCKIQNYFYLELYCYNSIKKYIIIKKKKLQQNIQNKPSSVLWELRYSRKYLRIAIASRWCICVCHSKHYHIYKLKERNYIEIVIKQISAKYHTCDREHWNCMLFLTAWCYILNIIRI